MTMLIFMITLMLGASVFVNHLITAHESDQLEAMRRREERVETMYLKSVKTLRQLKAVNQNLENALMLMEEEVESRSMQMPDQGQGSTPVY